MADDNKIYVTEEGLQKLKDEYDNLVHVVREQVKAELAEARSQGDLSENADYDAAREKQSEVESRIAELEGILQNRNYEIIDTKKGSNQNVRIGSTVTLEFMDTREKGTYTIVGTSESDPLNGKLSNESPLAAAILDARVGDTVEVNVAQPYKVIIVDIQ